MTAYTGKVYLILLVVMLGIVAIGGCVPLNEYGYDSYGGYYDGGYYGGGYYGDDGVMFGGPAYYEPYGIEYRGWGPDYRVAPFRHDGLGRRVGFDRGNFNHGGTYGHHYRPAPASHSMPSLPSRPRFSAPRVRR